MKKSVTTMMFMLLIIIFSCKKSNTGPAVPAPKDYATSIKDKTWGGMLTYTGQKGEYYSVHFNADNTLTWSQIAGDYPGQWAINANHLTITFPALGLLITGDVSDDNKLLNIADNTSSSEINSGELVENPKLPLDNTVWKGSYFNGSSQQSLELDFLPGSVLVGKFGALPAEVVTYTRSSSGAVIQFGVGGSYPFFAIINSDSEINGSTTSSAYPLQAIKQ